MSTSIPLRPFPKILQYPKRPYELSEPVLKHMFGDLAPKTIILDRFELTARCHVPLRKNSKLIKLEEQRDKGQSVCSAKLTPPTPTALETEPDDEPPEWAQKLLRSQNHAPQPCVKVEPVETKFQSRAPSC